MPTLKVTLKQKLLSPSARALRVSTKVPDYYPSFNELHFLCNRAVPEMFLKYKLVMGLYKLYNESFNPMEFAQLNFNQLLTRRQVLFKTLKSNQHKVGINSQANRLYYINDQIPLDWLNMSINTYKVKCKELNE